MAPDLPPEAVMAAALVLSSTEGMYDEHDYSLAEDVLRAATPEIRAAERERIISHLSTLQQGDFLTRNGIPARAGPVAGLAGAIAEIEGLTGR